MPGIGGDRQHLLLVAVERISVVAETFLPELIIEFFEQLLGFRTQLASVDVNAELVENLGQSVVASVCLHRASDGRFLVLSPCGVCRERLAAHGPDVLVAVADETDPTVVQWETLKDVLPHYWLTVFPEETEAWRR